MTVNKDIDQQQYKQTLADILPTQFEPGSLADRLLTQGREEGREEGRPALIATVRLLEELVGDPVSSEEALVKIDFETLTRKVAELQQRLRSRSE